MSGVQQGGRVSFILSAAFKDDLIDYADGSKYLSFSVEPKNMRKRDKVRQLLHGTNIFGKTLDVSRFLILESNVKFSNKEIA